jgi:hypothetical protein
MLARALIQPLLVKTTDMSVQSETAINGLSTEITRLVQVLQYSTFNYLAEVNYGFRWRFSLKVQILGILKCEAEHYEEELPSTR